MRARGVATRAPRAARPRPSPRAPRAPLSGQTPRLARVRARLRVGGRVEGRVGIRVGVRVRSGRISRLARRGRRGASTSIACAARGRPAPAPCAPHVHACTMCAACACLHHVRRMCMCMCAACAYLHHEHAALRIKHDATHADLREAVPGTCACACTSACIGCSLWHVRLQPLGHGVARKVAASGA